MNSPVISIIIPNYNRAALISETLQSIVAQTYPNWEAIVVDDGSTDESRSVIRNFISEDKRITLIERYREPKGAPTCRNIGLENAKGEYIIFLDSDDLLAPYCLATRAKHFKENPDYDFLVFSMLAFEKHPGDSTILWNINKDKDHLACFLKGDVLWSTTCPIWKKNAIEIIGNWNEDARLWQDWEFHIKAIAFKLKYKKISELPDCFVRRDSHNERISKTELEFEQMLNKFNLFNDTYNLLNSKSRLTSLEKRNFASTFFKLAQKSAIPYRNKELNKLFVPLTKNFSKKILEYELVPKPAAYLQLTYIYILLFIKVLRPYSISKILRSVTYRMFQKLLPWYLVKNDSELLRHSINAAELEQIKRLLSA